MSCRVIETQWIPMRDGTRLAARMWLPDLAGTEKVPAIIEHIPYRRRDGTRGRDEPMHSWFADQGYVVIRTDMRGSGDSDGLMDDEYLAVELNDACDVIAWIAEQPWSNGHVGMMGKSWGGFNCLQVAALRPPALKAILTVCSTDDRYADDIHYMGGCLLNDNLWWATIMLAYQSRPADPATRGPDWREVWRQRLEAMPFFPAVWADHQTRDAYWKHGSVCEDFAAIECPVFAVGGWADAYTNAIPRLLEGLSAPRLGLIGPWAHLYPQDGAPAPAIGFLQEATRWWDHWLKGRDTGIMAEPMLRAWMEEPTPPAAHKPVSPGRWVGEPVWPSPTITPKTLTLKPHRLIEGEAPEEAFPICSPQYHGAGMGEFMGMGLPGDRPTDQRLDDGFALLFETDAFTGPLDLLGAPIAHIRLISDKPEAHLVLRLSDVAPDGAATRISYGVLNLAHRDSHEHPAPLPVGEAVTVRLQLNDCGHVLRPGHRLRLSVATTCWPLIWPVAEVATLTIITGASTLTLPVRSPRDTDAAIRFEPPAHGRRAPVELVEKGKLRRSHNLDLLTDTATYITSGEGGVFGEGVIRYAEPDIEVAHSLARHLEIKGSDPLSARFSLTQSIDLGRDGWRIRVETDTAMSATATHFHLTGTIRTFENGAPFVTRNFDATIPRSL